MTLHKAVHQTTNKLLDKPEYVTLLCDNFVSTDQLEYRLYQALSQLGYGILAFDHEDHDGLPRGAFKIHPLAHKYFQKYGEQYVQLLEATQRLTQ